MIHSVKDIAQMLANVAENVCAHLLPGGKKNGGEWEAGSTAGEKGKSCKVRLSGDKAGIWADFAGSDSGDLLDLWAVSRNISLADAIQEAKKWLGINEPKFEPQKKTYAKPAKKDVKKLDGAAFKYLTEERGIEAAVLKRFKIGESTGQFGDSVAFPYFSPKGELLNVKYIGVQRDEAGKKIVRTEKDCAPALFGWQAFSGTGRTITITEGEIDAMTIDQYGFAALSVPFGAGKGSKNDWIDFEWDNLTQFETIYLCYDNDDAGQACVEEVARRLGIHRCRVVKLPFKDANECLQQGVEAIEIQTCFNEAKTFDPPEIRSPMEFHQKVVEYFHPTGERDPGLYPPIFNRKIGFRPGELTVWTGVNSHGKSVCLGQVMLWGALNGERIAIASPEMRPERTLARLLRQLWTYHKPTVEEITQALEWMSGKLWIYDVIGNVAVKKLLDLLEFSVRRHRVTQFVIDSLMKCDVDGDDYNSQRKFLNDAATFANTHGCHVHIVAHLRKADEGKPAGRMGISGSGDISNQADNIIEVWRNKALERGDEKRWSESQAVVLCDKQRETGWEGMIKLAFHKSCEQYTAEGSGPNEFWRIAGLISSQVADVPTETMF